MRFPVAVQSEAAFVLLFDGVEGRVGMAVEAVEIPPICRGQGDADAGRKGADPLVQVHGPVEGGQNLAGFLLRDRPVGQGEKDGELVTADPPHHVALSESTLQTLGEVKDYPVPRGVAKAVVDLLEVVNVHNEKACSCCPPLSSSCWIWDWVAVLLSSPVIGSL